MTPPCVSREPLLLKNPPYKKAPIGVVPLRGAQTLWVPSGSGVPQSLAELDSVLPQTRLEPPHPRLEIIRGLMGTDVLPTDRMEPLTPPQGGEAGGQVAPVSRKSTGSELPVLASAQEDPSPTEKSGHSGGGGLSFWRPMPTTERWVEFSRRQNPHFRSSPSHG
jgi:hypothetical protein